MFEAEFGREGVGYYPGMQTYLSRALMKVGLASGSAIAGAIAVGCLRDYRSWRSSLWEPLLGFLSAIVCLASLRLLLRYRAPALHESLRRRGF